jgi:hypothetical protein
MANPYGKVVLARISDSGGGNPELKTLVLSAVSGTATMSGFFVDARGDQVGQSITLSITTATTLTNVLSSQQKIDSGWNDGQAVGFIGKLSGSDIYIGTGGNPDDGSIRSGMSPGSTYPKAAIGEYFTLGRVSSVVNNGSPTISGSLSGTLAVTQSGTWDEVGINDSGNSITVDAPVGTPVNVQIGDGTRTVTVRDTGSSDSLNVAVVDAAGNQLTSFGTQYTFGTEQTGTVTTGTAIPLFDGSGGRPSRSAGTLKIRICNCSKDYGLAVRYGTAPTSSLYTEYLAPLETRDLNYKSGVTAQIIAIGGSVDYIAQELS